MTTGKSHTILIVDDEPLNINVLMNILREDYRLVAARNGMQALERARADSRPDLILLDVMMPEMDGFEVCRKLKADTSLRDIPVIFVTALSDEVDETLGLSLGAADYLNKPVAAPIVKARIKNHLALKSAREQLQNQNEILEARVKERTRDLVLTQDIAILSLASLAETRDNETGNHIRRTQHYVRALADHLRSHARFSDVLNDEVIEQLYKSAPLHDIGKVGIPDRILLKPDKLTDEEFAIMKQHATLGGEAIIAAEKALLDTDGGQGATAFLNFAREIAMGHHEKWDGTGYPVGLSGADIPMSARLMAVADVYDALISARVYKPAFPHEKAVEIIVAGSGKHFDPDMVTAFEALGDVFQNIAAEFADPSPH
ncbi:MAG: response regulator [Magnetospiraceae bacterium]